MQILLVDDDQFCREGVADFLENHLGHRVNQCARAEQALECFARQEYQMVLSDIRMPGADGIELLQRLKSLPNGRETAVVIFTGYGDMDTVISALRGGAYDFLLKPLSLRELGAVVNRVAEQQFLRREWVAAQTPASDHTPSSEDRRIEERFRQLSRTYCNLPGIGRIGVYSRQMQAVVSLADRLHSIRSVPVLIEGETGTGKEIIARLVHHGPDGSGAPFVSINCSAISANLFESELFGYEGGAFTGARKEGSPGKLELARGGTLLLDEIGDLPLDLQPKLLRLLEEKEFYRVGGLKKIVMDVRIICATNRELHQMVERGVFRRDLFFRLNIGRIVIPPLRSRREDIRPLAALFLEKHARNMKSGFVTIGEEAFRVLESHPWTGNVRELHNAIERAVLFHDDRELGPEHLGFLTGEDQVGSSTHDQPATGGRTFVLELPPERLDLKQVERQIVTRVLELFEGNKSRTADYFGFSRSSLRRKLEGLED